MRKAPGDARSAAIAPLEQTELNAETIRQLIEQGLPGARADVRGDDGVHFEATVVAEAFRGKLPLARHRLVYATLGERMGGEIHALALKTVTPEEAA
jgi:acid stress-induced BolA-like protein IbaG/YrbA